MGTARNVASKTMARSVSSVKTLKIRYLEQGLMIVSSDRAKDLLEEVSGMP